MAPADFSYQIFNQGEERREGGIALVVQAEYHLRDALGTAEALEAKGVSTSLVVRVPPSDRLSRLRASTRRHSLIIAGCAQHGLDLVSEVSADTIANDYETVVVRNDWGPERSLVERFQRAGKPTFGWVEGVQDFTDRDTGFDRQPYQTVDHVLTLGQYDAEILSGLGAVSVTPVGSPRLRDLWNSSPDVTSVDALINVNFTYGVLTRHRRSWVRDAIQASAAANLQPVVSRHPADHGVAGRRFENHAPVDDLLAISQRLITRFSTLAYDALLLGVDTFYYNPHGEGVPTFATTSAVHHSSNRVRLEEQLAGPARTRSEVRERARPFLTSHLVLDGPSSAVRAAKTILSRLRDGV